MDQTAIESVAAGRLGMRADTIDIRSLKGRINLPALRAGQAERKPNRQENRAPT